MWSSISRVQLFTVLALLFVPQIVRGQNPPVSPPPVIVPGARTAAQDAASAMGKNVTNAQIADAIKKSGLTEVEVRARLQSSGYDPKLADPFFGMTSNPAAGASPATGTSQAGFANALQALGILKQIGSQDPATEQKEAETPRARAPAGPGELAVFGKEVFSRSTSAFQPVSAGPVDASYRLGPGDQLQLVLTGDVELAYSLEVRRDGSVIIPQIGQVSIAGLTLDAARGLLKQRAQRVYSAVGDGKASLDLSVSRIRTNQIFVIGEVEHPGSYELNALGTVFYGLAAAGGPTVRGSFRNIEIRRADSVIARVDLYDYLLRGDANGDIRLQQGDVVFVPLNRRAVAIRGAVRRQGIFELKGDEGFAQLLQFAGDLLPTAATARVQIDRVLPPEQRAPGKERALIDIQFKSNYAVLDSARLYDNDIVTVFEIGDVRRNAVALHGEVYEPGTYELTPGLTLGGLVVRAQGFLPWALTDRIKIERPVVHTGRGELYSLDMKDSSSSAFKLQEFDLVTVLDGRKAYPAGSVEIAGAVHLPGVRTYVEHQTLQDLIDVANGFQPWALTNQVKLTRTDTTSGQHQFFSFNMANPSARAFALERSDRVDVLDARTATVPATVQIMGAVVEPGTRSFAEHQTLADLTALAGGFKAEAAIVELARRRTAEQYSDTSSIVYTYSILANRHLSDGGDTVTLARGDIVSVRKAPGYRATRTVDLVGSFAYPGVYVLLRDGERVSDVIRRAGGLLPSAFGGSFKLKREGQPVAVQFERILKGEQTDDINLRDGDRLEVGSDPAVVYVGGEVERQVVVPYRQGWNVDDYIDAAGGYSITANKGSIVVESASGSIQRKRKVLYFFSAPLSIKQGATITVGKKPESKGNEFGQALTTTVQVTSALVSLIIGYLAIKKL
jgi:polysaccharide export outer membrane protein